MWSSRPYDDGLHPSGSNWLPISISPYYKVHKHQVPMTVALVLVNIHGSYQKFEISSSFICISWFQIFHSGNMIPKIPYEWKYCSFHHNKRKNITKWLAKHPLNLVKTKSPFKPPTDHVLLSLSNEKRKIWIRVWYLASSYKVLSNFKKDYLD